MGTAVMEPVDRLRAALADRYVFDREIGRGGMAQVYRAHDRHHNRDVAIKVLRSDLTASLGADRFLREIHIEARLQHPHILPLHDSGSADGLLYYVMPYVEGETLRDRIRREKQLPLAESLQIAHEVADALSYAHAHGVVHRDIKPANILLSGGHAIVADFGIARAISVAGEEPLTETGIALGTPEYMSPEQGSGGEEVDGRTDIYALGCVLFEMLAGDPPFTGRTAQGVLARHRHDSPPSLRVVRPTIPPEIEEVIATALAKVPADRYPTASALNEALTAGSGRPRRPARAILGRKARLGMMAGVGLLVVVGAWGVLSQRSRAADSSKVMVFPLVDHGGRPDGARAGEEVAILIGSALEHTEPLRWIDGWTRMDGAQRNDARLLTTPAARALSRREQARFYIDGSIVRAGDSATVVLRLYDAIADSLVAKASASGSSDPGSVAQLGLRAIGELLPAILEPGRRVDPAALGSLSSTRPAAIADWLQGERQYRRSQFQAALSYFRRAVGADSAFAIAALRGAQTASWLDLESEADTLLSVALAHEPVLPAKYGQFAHGLRDYLSGEADSAVTRFRQALAIDSTWASAWMSLGEVYFHLFPHASSLDSLAGQAFTLARHYDPEFSPPLYHLAELALSAGEDEDAERLIQDFRLARPDSGLAIQFELMLKCVRNRAQEVPWDQVAVDYPTSVLHAAKSLSAGGRQLGCAKAGFAAALRSRKAALDVRWSALLGLQSVLVAEGRAEEARALLDSAVASGVGAANFLYVLDAAAGAPMSTRPSKVVGELSARLLSIGSPSLWVLGVWAFQQNDRPGLAVADSALRHRADSSGDRLELLLSRALSARVALAQADTVRALGILQSLTPVGRYMDFSWGLWESMGAERLLLAELLLAKADYHGALAAASLLDKQQPVIYLLYLPGSLAVRLAAAQKLGNVHLASELRRRWDLLGRQDHPVSFQ